MATGVDVTGERRILGLDFAPGNDEGSAWPAFIRSLCERGLAGVRLVISDDHRGLVEAVDGDALLRDVVGLDPIGPALASRVAT